MMKQMKERENCPNCPFLSCELWKAILDVFSTVLTKILSASHDVSPEHQASRRIKEVESDSQTKSLEVKSTIIKIACIN